MGLVYSDYSVVLFPEAHDIGLFFVFQKKEIDLADKYLPKVLLGLRLHLLGTGLLT